MKSFTKQEIDQIREEIINRQYPKKTTSMNNQTIEYFLMPNELFQGIPNGLFRMTGEQEDGYIVGVSEQVPELIQPHFAVSEHNEFMVYGLKDKNRTIHSEQNIVKILEKEEILKPLYINNKLKLYDHMLIHSKKNLKAWYFTQEDYKGFQKAKEYLEQQK